MAILTGATWVAAFLVVLAGTRKITDPSATSAALQTARLPSDLRLVRLVGAGEIVLGTAVLAVGGPAPTALLAVAYAAFAVVARRQRRSGSDCGCFGQRGTPVTALHVGVNATVAGVAALAAVAPGAALAANVIDQPTTGALSVVLVIVAAQLLRLVLTTAPELAAAIALVEPDAAP